MHRSDEQVEGKTPVRQDGEKRERGLGCRAAIVATAGWGVRSGRDSTGVSGVRAEAPNGGGASDLRAAPGNVEEERRERIEALIFAD